MKLQVVICLSVWIAHCLQYPLIKCVYTKKFNTTAFVHRRVQEYYRNALQLTIILQLVNSTLQLVNSTLML